jgi:copper homeostasis protein CutC
VSCDNRRRRTRSDSLLAGGRTGSGAGGATRIELTVRLDQDGLTPPLELARTVVTRLRIPVRVMLRDRTDFEVGSVDDLARLKRQAVDLAGLGVDGLVTGYVSAGQLDFQALESILGSVRGTRFTIHHAVEATHEPAAALRQLCRFLNVDRALVSGGAGGIRERVARLERLREAFAGRTIVVGGGLTLDMLPALREDTGLTMFHLGRAVRTPANAGGRVDAAKVRSARTLLGIAS